MMAHPNASDDDLINMIREDFSECPNNERGPGGATPHASEA